jgi:hypothetical protein
VEGEHPYVYSKVVVDDKIWMRKRYYFLHSYIGIIHSIVHVHNPLVERHAMPLAYIENTSVASREPIPGPLVIFG